MRCPKCGKPLVCAACAGSVGGAARVAKGFASADVQAKAQATRKRKARAARNSHNTGHHDGAASAPSVHGFVVPLNGSDHEGD